jgi:hypothetical protein
LPIRSCKSPNINKYTEECIILISLKNATLAFQNFSVLKGRYIMGLRYWNFCLSEEYGKVFRRGTSSSLHYMSFLASKGRLRKKFPLLFVIALLVNNFIFPGFYSCLPRGEKV